MDTPVTTYFNTDIGGFIFDAWFSAIHEINFKKTEEEKQVIFNVGIYDEMEIIFYRQFGDDASSSVSAYKLLMELQSKQLPIQVTTKLAKYENMQVTKISIIGHNTTGNSLRVTLKEISVLQISTIKISDKPQVNLSTNHSVIRIHEVDSIAAYKIKSL